MSALSGFAASTSSSTTYRSTAEPAIVAERLWMSYSGKGRQSQDLTALADVTLDVRQGEFVSLLGPSGCGKSTLLRLIGDLLQPSQGTLQVKGKSAGQARRDRDYGMVFQAPALYDWRTVSQNVQLPLELLGVKRSARDSRASELLRLMNLQDFSRSYPWQLSGGMQQRVSIARALSFRPSILLMDEPFGALDEMTRERLNMELLSIWAQTGTTIIFVTHSVPEAVFLSDRVAVMTPRPGKVERMIDIDLPRPRETTVREDPGFFRLVAEVRACLREENAI